MAQKALTIVILSVFALTSVAGVLTSASCSMGGHSFLMKAVGVAECHPTFIQHLMQWQAALLAIVASIALLVALAVTWLGSVVDAVDVENFWKTFRFRFSHSINMKFFDPLRLALAAGVIGAKRFETVIV